MASIKLTTVQRKTHRALAHHLDPVVMIGNDGLTSAVVKETDLALSAHGLIKIRVLGDDRLAREIIFQALADQLHAAPIQHIGKLLVLWRPQVEKEKPVNEERQAGPRGGQRPEMKRVTVLGNERLTAGGQIKRAKPKIKSIKKSAQS